MTASPEAVDLFDRLMTTNTAPDALAVLDAGLDKAKADALAPILELHRPDGGSGGPGAMCVTCTPDFGTPAEDPVKWPCPTAIAAGVTA